MVSFKSHLVRKADQKLYVRILNQRKETSLALLWIATIKLSEEKLGKSRNVEMVL
jgi:hypothetical protein